MKAPSIRSRAFATLIDYGVYLALFVIYVVLLGSPTNEGGYTVTGWPALGVAVIWFLYFPLCERLFGRTPGKMPFGLRVIRADLKPLTLGNTIRRRLADFADVFFYGIPGYIAIRKSPLGQRLGDMWAGTRVVADESVICEGCGAEVELQGAEVVRREFVCPVCRAKARREEKAQ